ncbi:MAG: CDP-diacylglycerol--serine O-phosphatidyltransferase [Candidatus Cryptobacteroides sp.]
MRIIKHIPNTITSMNLLAGTLGVIFTFDGRMDLAFPMMIAAACFDFCDGLAARLLGAYSEIGKELDSLADMVSFGVLPSLMMYCMMESDCPTRFIPLCIAVFSALRLAKFNVDEMQHSGFLGIPTPACAMICGSMVYCAASGAHPLLRLLFDGPWFAPVVAVLLSMLLVCRIPMFAMKFGKGTSVDSMTNYKRMTFLLSLIPIVAGVVLMNGSWAMIVLLSFSFYIILNLFFAIFLRRSE